LDEVFREIGNSIGLYYDADHSFTTSGYMGMARILVGIKLSDGLIKNITITHKGTYFNQALDYEGIPFKCGRCHTYGHITRDCARRVCSL
jgi:hypothetical protein